MHQASRPDYMARLQLDETELVARRRFFEIEEVDLARLASLKGRAEAHIDEVVEAFYALLQGDPHSQAFLEDPDTLRRLRQAQRRYFLTLFDGRCDLAYVEERLRVGVAHERIGLPVKWYLGAYALYLRLAMRHIIAELPAADAALAFESLEKLVFFDSTLAIETYIAAQNDAVARHQVAIRELSTPVIVVHSGVLLLPLVGTIDSHRAWQIMETVLERVSEDQARVLILDIAGVAVVDTQVAVYLLKATAAVRLLGASTILTGISPQVARTIVELGVDISTMHTRSKLADGIDLALAMVGRRIVADEKP